MTSLPPLLYKDGIADVVIRGPHQSDTSKNLAEKVLSAIENHSVLSGSGYFNNQGVVLDWQWVEYHYDIFVKCSKWDEPVEADRKEIPV
ncbi:hypothetical protein K8T06_12055, partial [bacterium]|nr:hypothetical protein [bacterium]